MGVEQNFGLALNDIKKYISSRSLNYLTSVLKSEEKECSDSSRGTVGDGDGHSSNWSASSGSGGIGTLSADFGDTKSEDGSVTCRNSGELLSVLGRREVNKHAVSVTLPFVVPEEEEEKDGEGARGRREQLHLLSSAQQLQQGMSSRRRKDALLCSHLYPVCRKILNKTQTPPVLPRPSTTTSDGQDLDVKSVSELVEREKSSRGVEKRDTPYRELIGKISEPRVQKDFARVPLSVLLSPEKKAGKTGNGGVCDLSHPISNPLYKVYNPQGYQKSEDELAREHIARIGREFNDWLSTLEGDLVQLDPQLLTHILRDELQLPEKNKRHVHSLLKISQCPDPTVQQRLGFGQ